MKKIISGIALCLSVIKAETVLIDEGKRLHFTISRSGMNRIQIIDDRISAIYGDKHAFVTEADGLSGQVFLRLKHNFNEKKIYLTLLSEGGLTQDLEFSISDVGAKSIVLKGKEKEETSKSAKDPMTIIALRQLMTGEGVIEENLDPQELANYKRPNLMFKGKYRLRGNLIGLVYGIDHDHSHISDQDISIEGDKAMSRKRTPKQTYIFIVRGE